jgi:hypothetical protein
MHTSQGSELAETALSSFIPYVSIIYGDDKGCIIPCRKDVCYEPIFSQANLEEFLEKIPSL